MPKADLPRDQATELLAQTLRFATPGLSALEASLVAATALRRALELRDSGVQRRREKADWVRENKAWNERDAGAPPEPKHNRPRSASEILGVTADASAAAINAAFRRRAQILHPDSGGSHDAMAELTAARAAMLRKAAMHA